jgi:hypothetical protein
MKAKLLILAVVLCAFVLCSCSKEDIYKATRQPEPTKDDEQVETKGPDDNEESVIETKVNELMRERKRLERENLVSYYNGDLLECVQQIMDAVFIDEQICTLTDDERCYKKYDREALLEWLKEVHVEEFRRRDGY